ncbi:MAG TPA: copper resistance protein CopC [Chloroflexota bacterium]|nr:copper resistance protein CopC [Chloroflexota bacterium]
MRAWSALLLAFALFVLSAMPEAVLAHAILLRTDPAPNQQLPTAPAQVRLLFSEPIDPQFSRVAVFNSEGVQVDRGDSHVDDTQLLVSLPPGLPNGAYGVQWRSLSTIDVHPEVGEYQLFVGVPVTATTAASTSQRSESTPPTVFARWWLYVAASLFAGALATWKVVLGPLLGAETQVRNEALGRGKKLAVIAGVLLLVGTLFAAVAQAAAAAGVPLESSVGAPLRDLLTRGRFAGIWWPRFAISLVAVVIVAWRGLDDAWSESAAAMVPAILLTNSLTSHGAALPSAITGVVLDWLHVLAAAVWVGGLATLALVAPLLRPQPSLLQSIVRRFTWLAGAAVVALVASGTVQAIFEVGSLDALVNTMYGQGILVKIGLLLAMLAIALAVRTRRKMRAVRVELALGVVVLAVAAIVAGTTPARQSAPIAPPAAVQSPR